ncbi:hypothetical protein AN639_04090 [Candidatus Epulonipiscium fishelsonii]|uniref:Uncharacterized protein n=1 Tax=Candidatus Epulonipiscium fishelsonii TaxID=77094 RepID=A0ACC8XCG7_9FIRM|nr:hypothetical protein AN396_06260 [Epulopiscium sp. SCG-B11WGA-EpuloA1]ONI41119.1 hypothetical protein AN639_04090 [Epulopiscium sp. SCG-B05WGA-EpuloA1]
MRSKIVLITMAIAMLLPATIYGEVYGEVNVNILNARETTSVNSGIVLQLDKYDKVQIVEQIGDWAKIRVGNNEGYVMSNFLDATNVIAEAKTNGVQLRSYPDENASITLLKLNATEDVVVEYKVNDWYKVQYNNTEGFVHKDHIMARNLQEVDEQSLAYVNAVESSAIAVANTSAYPSTYSYQSTVVHSPQTVVYSPQVKTFSSPKTVTVQTSNTSLGQQIVNTALKYRGVTPYKYGGTSLKYGADCSGFVQQIYKMYGINLSRNSAAQYANDGYNVSTSNMMPGDLIFYGNGVVSHVAIYMGGGQVVHCSDYGTDVIVGSAYHMGKPIIGVKRVIY